MTDSFTLRTRSPDFQRVGLPTRSAKFPRLKRRGTKQFGLREFLRVNYPSGEGNISEKYS